MAGEIFLIGINSLPPLVPDNTAESKLTEEQFVELVRHYGQNTLACLRFLSEKCKSVKRKLKFSMKCTCSSYTENEWIRQHLRIKGTRFQLVFGIDLDRRSQYKESCVIIDDHFTSVRDSVGGLLIEMSQNANFQSLTYNMLGRSRCINSGQEGIVGFFDSQKLIAENGGSLKSIHLKTPFCRKDDTFKEFVIQSTEDCTNLKRITIYHRPSLRVQVFKITTANDEHQQRTLVPKRKFPIEY